MAAVALLLLFYGGALALAGTLLVLPYVLYTTHRFHALLTVLCLAGAGLLGWAAWPRRERFEPPGPRLTEAEHPRLFAFIHDVARAMDTAPPDEVYLVADVNAYVCQVGGFLGLGGRRVLSLGMGLLAVDNLSQLRAAVAHELGHFVGGDTRLAGALSATRAAMVRTLGGRSGFTWVPETFLRLTQARGRRQELVADTWSVRLAGRAAHLSGLLCEAVHAQGYRRFVEQEVRPLALRGVLPDNLFEGYRRYLTSRAWAESAPEREAAVPERACRPYDSHPSPHERIAFAQALDVPEVPVDDTPATVLLSDAEALERRFTARWWPHPVRLVPWSEVAGHWGALWNETAARVQARVPDFCWARVAALAREPSAWDAFAEALHPRLVGDREPERAERVREVVAQALSAYAASLLAARGPVWCTSPGEPLSLEGDGERWEPAAWVEALLDGVPGAEGEGARWA